MSLCNSMTAAYSIKRAKTQRVLCRIIMVELSMRCFTLKLLPCLGDVPDAQAVSQQPVIVQIRVPEQGSLATFFKSFYNVRPALTCTFSPLSQGRLP